MTTNDWHPSEITCALRMKGTNLRKLSIASGYKPGTLGNALRFMYPKAERIIADVIGVPPEAIWPSRYISRAIRHKSKREQPGLTSSR